MQKQKLFGYENLKLQLKLHFSCSFSCSLQTKITSISNFELKLKGICEIVQLIIWDILAYILFSSLQFSDMLMTKKSRRSVLQHILYKPKNSKINVIQMNLTDP